MKRRAFARRSPPGFLGGRRREAVKIAVLILLQAGFYAQPVWGQSSPTTGTTVVNVVESAKTAAGRPLSAVAITPEIRELLQDRQLIFGEINRIRNASGEAVVIAVPIVELEKRAAAKWARFQAWLKASGIPVDWDKAGWSFDGQTFTPPAPAKEPAKEPPKTEAPRP
ncbi:MAG: hypothetical protein ACREB3_01245 [Burkholderiales bacterium]